jgi:hypothetical protein
VAIIGCRIRGKQHAEELAHLSDCEIAYVCDPDRNLADELSATVAKRQGTTPKTAQDQHPGLHLRFWRPDHCLGDTWTEDRTVPV